MGMSATETVRLRLDCDSLTDAGGSCAATLEMVAESLAKAVLQAKAQGWQFRFPLVACPACRLPEVPSGRATMITR